MKYKVKFNTRNINKVFGVFADDIKWMCEEDRSHHRCDDRAVKMLTDHGLAKVTCKGPGWSPEVSVDLDAMRLARLVVEWGIR